MQYQLKIDGKEFQVDVGEIDAGSVRVDVNGRPYTVTIEDAVAAEAVSRPSSSPPAERRTAFAPKAAVPAAAPMPGSGTGEVTAPIPGLILKLTVAVGDAVSAGQTVAVIEAMKMENNLTTAVSGIVQNILVQKGSEVAMGDVIMTIA